MLPKLEVALVVYQTSAGTGPFLIYEAMLSSPSKLKLLLLKSTIFKVTVSFVSGFIALIKIPKLSEIKLTCFL